MMLGNRKEEGRECTILLHAIRKSATPSENRWTCPDRMPLLYHLCHRHFHLISLDLDLQVFLYLNHNFFQLLFQTPACNHQHSFRPCSTAMQELRPQVLAHRHGRLLAASGLALQDEEAGEGVRQESPKPDVVLRARGLDQL